MVTRTEGERLAVVEDQLSSIRADVIELKHDMKTLLQHNAAQDASDKKGNRNTELFLKTAPLFFSTISLLFTLIAMGVIVQQQGGIK